MSKKLAAEKKLRELLGLTEQNLSIGSRDIEKTRELLKLINGLSRVIDLTDKDLKDIILLLKFRMLIGFISLDLTSSTRNYLKAEIQYEGQFALRQFFVIINEGYKKIYHFEGKSERSKSFWVKNIKQISNDRGSDLLNKYVEITDKLDNYFDDHFEGIYDVRNLSIHYDENLAKFYDEISKLKISSIIKKYLPFHQLLNEIGTFTNDLILTYDLRDIGRKSMR